MKRKLVIRTKSEYERLEVERSENPSDFENVLVILVGECGRDTSTERQLLDRKINRIKLVPPCLRSEEDEEELSYLIGQMKMLKGDKL